MVSHIGSTDPPFISEMLDWDDHADLLDLGLVEEDDELITNENPIMSPFWNDVFLVTSSTSPPKVGCCVFYFIMISHQ